MDLRLKLMIFLCVFTLKIVFAKKMDEHHRNNGNLHKNESDYDMKDTKHNKDPSNHHLDNSEHHRENSDHHGDNSDHYGNNSKPLKNEGDYYMDNTELDKDQINQRLDKSHHHGNNSDHHENNSDHRGDKGDHHGDESDHHSDKRNHKGDKTDHHIMDEKDNHRGENDFYGDENDLNGNGIDLYADENDLYGDENDLYVDENDLYADENDLYGDEDDLYGDEKNLYGDENNLYGDENNLHGDENDRHRDENDLDRVEKLNIGNLQGLDSVKREEKDASGEVCRPSELNQLRKRLVGWFVLVHTESRQKQHHKKQWISKRKHNKLHNKKQIFKHDKPIEKQPGPKKRSVDSEINIEMHGHCKCLKSVMWEFRRMDASGDGHLNYEELASIESIKREPCLKPMIKSCDKDNDGRLSRGEWCCCMANTVPPCAEKKRLSDKADWQPRCDAEGYYEREQCHTSGYCWCVDIDGNQIISTKTMGSANCGKYDPNGRLIDQI